MSPYRKKKVPVGVQIRRIPPKSLFAQIGLRSGDIIRGPEGEPLETVMEAEEFLYEALQKDKIELEIVRRGHPTNLKVNIF